MSHIPSHHINRLAEDDIIEGEVWCADNIRVDGQIIGLLVCKAKVLIGKTGKIFGDVYCDQAEIAGVIEGNLHALGAVHFKDNATLTNNVYAAQVLADAHANLLGNIYLNPLSQLPWHDDTGTPQNNDLFPLNKQEKNNQYEQKNNIVH